MPVIPYHCNKGVKNKTTKIPQRQKKIHYLFSIFSLCTPVSFAGYISQQNRGVMVTPKKCKFLQLCELQIGVQLKLLSCTFTPKWYKSDDLHTILNVFKNTFAVLQQH